MTAKTQPAPEAAAPAAAREAPPKRWRARFDAAGGLVGFDETTAAGLAPGDVAFDHLPDNACDGRYRWDANLKRFEPIKERLLEIGETAAYNQLVVAGIVGLADEETLPLAVKEDIALIRNRSPGTIRKLKQKYSGLAALRRPRRA